MENKSGLIAGSVLWIAGTMLSAYAAPVHLVDEKPVSIIRDGSGVMIVDFGRVAFGNVRLVPSQGTTNAITVHFGEAAVNGRINRTPPGTVRYNKVDVKFDGKTPVVAAPPPDSRNTENNAIRTPPEWDVVMPFRWVEIECWDGELLPEQIIRQSAFATTWDDDAAAFESSEDMLNQIWELCRYSIKATTFAGLYVDGDRERIPYEADAYLNQLCHYFTDNDLQMARDTFDHLMQHGTWPTEWAPQLVFMAYADWMQTGDVQWLEPRYEALKSKLLSERVGSDGLVVSNAKQIERDDIVDWPPNERDGYVRTEINTVVNAFHLRALEMMVEMARATGNKADARAYTTILKTSRDRFLEKLFNAEQGLYFDGTGTDHISLHANLFPLAFGLVPEEYRGAMADWLAGRGMACSVYAAQYLMEALFENGAATQAIEIMTASNDRSWRHMVESGTTITWEAWDQKFKPNQDWNHAWGAAPANLLPRYVLGVQPLAPGWKTALIRPNIGNLHFAKGRVPTPLGPILIEWKQLETFTLALTLPKGMSARVELPVLENSTGVFRAGVPVKALHTADRWIIDSEVKGTMELEVK